MLIHPTTNSHILAFSTTRDCIIDVPVNAPLLMPTHQVHGTKTMVIDTTFLSLSPLEQALQLHGVDALCTDIPCICIAVKTADCIPILLYTDDASVISAVHAGWKGTLQRIVEHNIDLLTRHYGIQPHQLHAVIGPGISLKSFEVGDEVYEQFQAAHFPMNQIARKYPSSSRQESSPSLLGKAGARLQTSQPHDLTTSQPHAKWHIDLWEANRLQLLGMGLKDGNIHVAGIDTMTTENFYSARRMKLCDGRIINGIMIKE